jgi:ABC-2 type transport system permease protein
MSITDRDRPEVETAAAAPAPVNPVVASLRGLYIIWYRDLIRYRRDRMRLLASLAQPILYLVVFGTGLGASLRVAAGPLAGAGTHFNYKQFLFGGVMGMAVLFTSIFSAMSIVWDKEFGFLKEILVAPIKRWTVAVGKTLGGATQAMIQGLILLALAPLAGVKLKPLTILELIPLVFVLAFGLTAMGVALSSRMRTLQSFQAVMNFLMLPLFFLSGALFPLNGLPGWMSFLTRIDPVSYGVDPLRRVVLRSSGVPSSLTDTLAIKIGGQTLPIVVEAAIVLGFGLIMLAIAIRGFRVRD